MIELDLPFSTDEWNEITRKCVAVGETPSHFVYVILRTRLLGPVPGEDVPK